MLKEDDVRQSSRGPRLLAASPIKGLRHEPSLCYAFVSLWCWNGLLKRLSLLCLSSGRLEVAGLHPATLGQLSYLCDNELFRRLRGAKVILKCKGRSGNVHQHALLLVSVQ